MQKTETGIYYLHPYYPKDLLDSLPEETANISRRIWDFKNGDPEEISRFAQEILDALIPVAVESKSPRFLLAAVPSSKKDKVPPMRTAISWIAQQSKDGVLLSKYGTKKKFFDYGDLLTRTKDVETAHLGTRPTAQDHKASISCREDALSRKVATIVLLDDVTTSGTIMDVCRDILVEHGAKKFYIIRMALARTTRDLPQGGTGK